MHLVLLASVVLVLVLAPATAKDTNLRTGNSLRMLLTEANPPEEPALLSFQDCLALPVNEAGGDWGVNGCGGLLHWFPSWPYNDNGHCASGLQMDSPSGTQALAHAKCADDTDGGTLINMRNNAERCLVTYWVNSGTSGEATVWYWTAINDVAEEGTYVDADGNEVPSVYLNWATGEPDGADEDCVLFYGNEAYDWECDNFIPGNAVCVKDVPAN